MFQLLGLEYLSVIDQLLVHQQVEIMEVLTGFETNNKYAIKNALGQLVYFAVEDTDCCTRNCCGPGRPFDIKILDNSGREVMHVQRPFRCYYNCCGCICCLQELSVFAPPGKSEPEGDVSVFFHFQAKCRPCFMGG